MRQLTARLLFGVFAAVTLLIAAQKISSPRRPSEREYPAWEVKVTQPVEISPARYRQITEYELNEIARQGWELVGVAPYTYLNEERGRDRTMVTQTYPSYIFKRLRKDQ